MQKDNNFTYVFVELALALGLPLATSLVQRVEFGVGEVARLHVLVATRVDAVATLVADGVLFAEVGDIRLCKKVKRIDMLPYWI